MRSYDGSERPQTTAGHLALRTNETLLRVARVFTGKPPTSKQALSDYLVAQTTMPLLRGTLDRIGPAGCGLLAVAAHGNGLLRTAIKAAPGIQIGSWQRDWNSPRHEQKVSPVLVFFPDGKQMPAELRQRLAGLLPAPPKPPLTPMIGAPSGAVIPSDPQGDIEVILHLAEASGLEEGDKGLTPACVRRLVASVAGVTGDRKGDRLRLDTLASLLLAGGLVQRGPRGLRAKQTCIDHAGLRKLFAVYETAEWDEVVDITCLRGRNDRYAPWSEPISRRRELLKALRNCPPGAWIAMQDFLSHAAATVAIDPLTEACGSVSIGNTYDGSLDALGEAGLDLVRDAWVRLVIYASLAPLGVVEIATGDLAPLPRAIAKATLHSDDFPAHLSPADTLTAFRITPLGAWILDLGPEPVGTTAAPGAWRIQTDGTVIALGQRIGAGERLLLDRLAERLDERSWRLTRGPLIDAIATGETAEAIRRQLEALSGSALPDLVARLLAEAQRRAGAAAIEGTVILLRVSDRHAAEQLLYGRSTAKLCRDLGGGLIAVDPTHLNDLRRAARKQGWHIPTQAP